MNVMGYLLRSSCEAMSLRIVARVRYDELSLDPWIDVVEVSRESIDALGGCGQRVAAGLSSFSCVLRWGLFGGGQVVAVAGGL
jgi:hypothetical protein